MILSTEDQVCSPELSKQLLTLGVSQNSFFQWHKYTGCNEYFLVHNGILMMPKQEKDEILAAYTVAELGAILPDSVLLPEDGHCFIKFQKNQEEYKAYLDKITNIIIFFSKNEADVRAKMLIYLLENRLIEI